MSSGKLLNRADFFKARRDGVPATGNDDPRAGASRTSQHVRHYGTAHRDRKKARCIESRGYTDRGGIVPTVTAAADVTLDPSCVVAPESGIGGEFIDGPMIRRVSAGSWFPVGRRCLPS